MPASPFAEQLALFETVLAGLTPWVDADLPFRLETPDITLDGDSAANNRLFSIEAEDAPALNDPESPVWETRAAIGRCTLKIRYDGQLDRSALRRRILSDDDLILGVFQGSANRWQPEVSDGTGVTVVTCVDGSQQASDNYVLRSLVFQVQYQTTVS